MCSITETGNSYQCFNVNAFARKITLNGRIYSKNYGSYGILGDSFYYIDHESVNTLATCLRSRRNCAATAAANMCSQDPATFSPAFRSVRLFIRYKLYFLRVTVINCMAKCITAKEIKFGMLIK